MLVPHDFADSTGFDMHISQATIDPLFSFPSPLSFLFLIRSYSEKHSRGIEFKEILRVQDGIVSHNIRRDSLDLKSYLFREVAHFVLSQQGPVVVPAVSKLLQHPSYTINSRWWKVGGGRMREFGCRKLTNTQLARAPHIRHFLYSKFGTAPSRDRRICRCKYHHLHDVSRSIILSSKSPNVFLSSPETDQLLDTRDPSTKEKTVETIANEQTGHRSLRRFKKKKKKKTRHTGRPRNRRTNVNEGDRDGDSVSGRKRGLRQEKEKWEARKRWNQVFQSYNSDEARTHGVEARNTLRMYACTHTHMYASTRAEPILFPILYPSPVYTFCRDGRRPMSHSTPLKCPRKSFSSPLANVFSRTFSPVFFQAFRTGIFRRNISDRPILYDYYYHRRFAVQPGNPHFHERRITTATWYK